jgi:hypothetical protein
MKGLVIVIAFWLGCIWLGVAFFGEEGIAYGWIFALLCLACGIPRVRRRGLR